MTVECVYTFDDFRAARRALAGNWFARNWVTLVGVPAALYFVVFGLVRWYGTGEWSFANFGAPVTVLTLVVSAPLNRRSVDRRRWDSQPDSDHHVWVTVTPAGVVVRTISETLDLPWQVFTHYQETEGLFLIYRSRALYYYFPKRMFGTPEEVEGFRQHLARYVRLTRYQPEPAPGFPVAVSPSAFTAFDDTRPSGAAGVRSGAD